MNWISNFKEIIFYNIYNILILLLMYIGLTHRKFIVACEYNYTQNLTGEKLNILSELYAAHCLLL